MLSTKRLILILPFWPLLLGIVTLFCLGKSPGFGVHKISSNFPYQKEWEINGLEDSVLKETCSQPFTYLGNGNQSFAFVSEDGKYVIKFFKMKYLAQKSWRKLVPLTKFQEKNARHEKRHKDIFSSCKMAFEELKEETGLLYVHLNPTKHLKQRVILLDKVGKKYSVDLDQTVFILQERAEMIYKRISHLIKAGNIEKAKTSLQAILALISSRNGKGFKDNDTNVSKNYGFVGDRPIHIDFLCLEKADHPNEKARIEAKLLDWLTRHYPNHLQFP